MYTYYTYEKVRHAIIKVNTKVYIHNIHIGMYSISI